MLVGGCSLELIAAEMERRWGFRPREAYRHAHGWSQDEVAARFTEVAERAERLAGDRAADRARAGRGEQPPAQMIGTRIGEYERWPNGGRRPSPYVLTVLATVLGTTVERLLDYEDHRKMPDQERTVLAAMRAAATPPVPAVATAPPVTPSRTPSPGPAEPTGQAQLRPVSRLPIRPPPPMPTSGTSREEPELSLARRVARPVPAPLPDQSPLPVAGDPAAPDAACAARRHRRDRLLTGTSASLPRNDGVIAEAAGQSAEFGEWAEATNIGPTTLEQLDEDVRRLAHAYLDNPPLPLLLATLRVRNRVFSLLEGRQHPDQTRHLYLTAGRLCGLLAWMSGDVGRHAEAETQARTGWLCAELAGSDGLRAWIRATQSKVAYWDGRIQESARLADGGLRFAASDTARVLLASLGARASARLGNADDAHAALARAQEEREHAGEDEVGGLYGFSEAQQSYLAGTTYLWLRDPERALRAADRAIWLYQVGDQAERFYGAEMLTLIDAATAHLQNNDLEGAAERLQPVLTLPQEQRLETFTLRLGEMRDTLRRSRYASSRSSVDMQRQIEDFRSGAIGQFLTR
jgi:transcriptional regulator with XRE-family HTH domain